MVVATQSSADPCNTSWLMDKHETSLIVLLRKSLYIDVTKAGVTADVW